jgi:hypothetical protein
MRTCTNAHTHTRTHVHQASRPQRNLDPTAWNGSRATGASKTKSRYPAQARVVHHFGEMHSDYVQVHAVAPTPVVVKVTPVHARPDSADATSTPMHATLPRHGARF